MKYVLFIFVIFLILSCSDSSTSIKDKDKDKNKCDLLCEHGVCELKDDIPQCVCELGYIGDICEIVEECDLVCEHGLCEFKNGNQECSCEAGYSGDTCDTFTGNKITFNVTDIWGRILNEGVSVKLIDENGEELNTIIENGKINLTIEKHGTYHLHLEKEDYFLAKFSFNVSENNGENSISELEVINNEDGYEADAVKTPKHAFVYHREKIEKIWEHKFYIGLTHKWFAPNAAPFTAGNKVDLFIDGEAAWKTVANKMNESDEILLTTLEWQSDFELLRPENHHLMTEEERAPNRLLDIVSRDTVKSKIIVAGYISQDNSVVDLVFNDDELKTLAEIPGDNFESMKQANPTNKSYRHYFTNTKLSKNLLNNFDSYSNDNLVSEKIAATFMPPHFIDVTLPTQLAPVLGIGAGSYHQKMVILDRKTGFLGGMNLSTKYWDDAEHRVFNEKRMKFGADAEARQKVIDKEDEPDNHPYKDYMVLINGPIVRDMGRVFKKRWNLLIDLDVDFADRSTRLEGFDNYITSMQEDGVEAQITVTMPVPTKEIPVIRESTDYVDYVENTILESHLLAVGQAKHYIYIEDQYFRMPIVNESIEKRMDEIPGLKLVVVTQPLIQKKLDPSCLSTHKEYKRFMKDSFRDRVAFIQFIAFDYETNCRLTSCIDETEAHFVDFFVHSKMTIIDDKYMSIGSCNKNNRGFLYEAEMNLAVYDKTWVTKERKRIFQNFMRDSYEDIDVEDFDTIFARIRTVSQNNQEIRDLWDDENDTLNLNQGSAPYNNIPGIEYIPTGFLYPLVYGDPDSCCK